MKRTVLLLALVIALPAWADDLTPNQLIDIGGGNKAVTFEKTKSPDGRYVIGFTIRPHAKNTKPVDWSSCHTDDDAIDTFIQTYAPYLPGEMDDDSPYELVDGVIDLKEKRFLELPAADPDYPHKNRDYFAVSWSPVVKGVLYAMIENDFRFETDNLWLVTIDSSGMHQKDLIDAVQKAVDPILAEKRPLLQKSLQTVYSVGKDAESGTNPLVFHDSTVIFPFSSDVPKSADENSEVLGSITLKLPEGAVLKASSDTERDDPFRDKPELAKADHALNEVYAQLSKKLTPAQKADLKKEQLDWLQQRDIDAAEALRTSSEDATAHDIHDARNKSLLDSTQKRVKELQTRLDALH